MSKTPIEVYDVEIRSGASLFEGIDAVAAHARREALEEAAKIAEDAWLGTELTKTYFNSLAAAIRALLNASPGSGGQEGDDHPCSIECQRHVHKGYPKCLDANQCDHN